MNNIIEQYMERYNPSSRADREQALREILQELTLIGLWRGKFFEHAAFYGGTALRILYGLDRFSEDLDFTIKTPEIQFSWDRYANAVVDELNSYGFNVEITEKKKTKQSAIQSAFLKTNTLESLIQIGTSKDDLIGFHSGTVVRIKIEIDTDPPPGLHYEQLYTKHPFSRPISVVTKPDLFASKMHAALYRAWKQRVKGRDWWDVVWFIRNDTPINLHHLAQCMRRRGHLDNNEPFNRDTLIDIFTKRVKELDISSAKEDVRPFIKDRTLLDEWTPEFFIHWIKQIRVEE